MKNNFRFDRGLVAAVLVIVTAILWVIEGLTIDFPPFNPMLLAVCGCFIGLGVLYMRLSMYKLKDLIWNVIGGLCLTAFVAVGGYFAYLLPVVIDWTNAGALASTIMVILAGMYIPLVYGGAVYLYIFCFCNMQDRIHEID